MNSARLITPSKTLFNSLLVLVILLCGCSSPGTDNNTGPSFSSGSLAPGETFSFTFEGMGTKYYCQNHEPNMTGEVIVNKNATISGQDTVIMRDLAFYPPQITVQPGTRIVWVNEETDPGFDPHTVTSGTPSNTGDGGYDY